MWRVEKEEPDHDPKKPITRALFPDRADVVVHDERGRVSCVCPETGEVRAMAFQGFEADRAVAAHPNTAARQPLSASSAPAARPATRPAA